MSLNVTEPQALEVPQSGLTTVQKCAAVALGAPLGGGGIAAALLLATIYSRRVSHCQTCGVSINGLAHYFNRKFGGCEAGFCGEACFAAREVAF